MTDRPTDGDPAVFASRVPARPERARLVLGLDLGTACGVALTYVRPGAPVAPEHLSVYLGQWDLSAGPYDSGAIRFVRLRQFLTIAAPDLVLYEDVKYTPPASPFRTSAQAVVARAATALEWFGALKGTLSTWCEEAGVPCTGFPIGAIKKRATGKGNANKADIIRAANVRFGAGLDPDGYESSGHDNIADALWVLVLGLEQYGAGLAGGSP
jgi:hypothetical protein